MQLSLSKLPWQGQIGAFVFVCAAAIVGFWQFYAKDAAADLATRSGRLATLQTEVSRAAGTAHRLPEFRRQVSQLEGRLEGLRAVLPEEKDVAGILRRLQGLATESNLSIQRFTPQPLVQQAMYAEVPFKLQAEGTYHDLGAFFDRISKFPRLINISSISIKTNPRPENRASIVAECVATTFVLVTDKALPAGQAAGPKPPVAAR